MKPFDCTDQCKENGGYGIYTYSPMVRHLGHEDPWKNKRAVSGAAVLLADHLQKVEWRKGCGTMTTFPCRNHRQRDSRCIAKESSIQPQLRTPSILSIVWTALRRGTVKLWSTA
ncbi:hypothetical protein PoB_005478200 [Plakobranchus ocellatus]|uniref:Uncharacterized protein n=1 Tax=Plakobranchus ocellatus TaxID=259542 RepID=A0AAV4CAG6_9GAST|nr:hypothetical protein PoB_005478200 [Plakobranchus ocellatus]